MALSNPSKAPRSYPETAPGNWTIPLVRTAIADLERGYLPDASRLTRALSRDPRYVQGREQFVGAVQGCPADVVAAPIAYGGVSTARRLAEEAGPMLGRVLADGAEAWLIEWGKVDNLAIGVLSWDTTARPWTPVSLTRWPLEAVRVDMYERRMFAQTQTGEREIIPGDGTWVVYAPAGLYNFDAALLRCFAEAFIARALLRRDLVNRTQASAVAALVAKLRPGDNALDGDEAIAIEEKLKALQTGSAAGILLPGDMPDPTALDLGGKNTMPLFELGHQIHTTDLLVPWLMQDGTATNEGGSLAKAQTLDGVMMSSVARTVSTLWGEERADGSHAPGVITEQILRPWALYQDADPRTVPLALRRVPDLEEDARLEAESARAVAFWTEASTIETRIGRPMTRAELQELAEMRGARVPASVLVERVVAQAPAPVPDPSAPVPDEEGDPADDAEDAPASQPGAVAA